MQGGQGCPAVDEVSTAYQVAPKATNGAGSVLAGVSRVGDDVAARVMARVHDSMAAGTASAEALATALADEPEPAPFVAFGATW